LTLLLCNFFLLEWFGFESPDASGSRDFILATRSHDSHSLFSGAIF
jgi:hypothetical protein